MDEGSQIKDKSNVSNLPDKKWLILRLGFFGLWLIVEIDIQKLSVIKKVIYLATGATRGAELQKQAPINVFGNRLSSCDIRHTITML
jgi:hypothetical protein